MKKYLLVSEKQWHKKLFIELHSSMTDVEWILMDSKNDFTVDELRKVNPRKVFIPHWSYIIPEQIYLNYDCIVFHMTDLPYGRGGSPLQNLIIRGHEDTKISALKVREGLDTGDIYLKKDLSLLGTAEEIFIRSSKIIFEMIKDIIINDLEPVPQSGEITNFKRRKPQDGDLTQLENLEDIYNYIRMLDAEGYPNAFIDLGNFRFEFSRASLKADDKIVADVRIFKK